MLFRTTQMRHDHKIDIQPKRGGRGSWMITVLAFLLKVFPKWRKDDFRDHYYTVIGRTIYVPGDGSSFITQDPIYLYSILSHELTHLDQQYTGDPDARVNHTEINPWTTYFHRIWYFISYLFVLPFFFTRRAQIEKWGYSRNIEIDLAISEITETPGRMGLYKDYYIDIFKSSAYGWMATEKEAVRLYWEMMAMVFDRQKQGKLDHLLPPIEG
jgi:hypothetical protein